MSGFDAGGFLTGLAVTFGCVLALLLVTFAVAVRIGMHRIVDVAWGLGFVVVAVVSFAWSSGHGNAATRTIVTLMTAVWGLRLAGYIGLRGRGHGEDPRYADLLARAQGNPNLYALRMIYLTQAVVLWFVSLPVQIAMYSGGSPGPLVWVGVVVWLVGLTFEAVGDSQLARFKADPASSGQVMDRGLWRYTRHPNYFGDACVWWGLFLVACDHWQGLLTVLSPLVMTYLLANGTGKPLLEGRMHTTRPGYADYVARTSGFIPRRPRAAAPSTRGTSS